MKKLLFLFALLFMGAMTAFAQVPVNEQLTYQTVVRNAQNKLVFSQDNVSVTVEVCKLDGSVVWYSENHTGLSTNANGLLTLMVGGGTLVSGAWSDIDWSDAAIRTTVSYDPGSGTVTIPSGLAPITAVPYALQAGNASSSTNIGDAIHDSIVNNINNNISEQIHDSIVNNINNIGEQIHDSIVNISGDLTDLENRVNTFNTHVCDSVKDCVTGWIHDSIANIADNISEQIHDSIVNNINNIGEQIHDSIVNNINNNISEQIHDSIVNNINNIGEQIHDSIVNISGDLTDLENRVNTFNTHVCDSVKDCVTGWIHDSIANIADNISEQIHDSIVNNINNISEQIHDSIVNISGDLTDLANRVNTFNTHVCDSVKDCVTGWIHDSIANIAANIGSAIHDSIANIAGSNSDLTDLENRVNTFNTHVCDSVKDCVTGWIHDSIANLADNVGSAIHDSIVNNINNNISEQIHDSIVNNLANSHYVTETVMGNAIHDSIAGLGDDLTDLANRVNTFNTHVCDSVKDCVTGWIHDSIANLADNVGSAIHDSIAGLGDDLTDLTNRVNTFNTHVCDSVKDCVTGWIHDSIANIADNISEQIHDSIVNNINNISEQIHDSIVNNLANSHFVTESSLCTTIETNCTNVALRDGNTFTGEHDFKGADSVTVPNAITPDLATALAAPCNQEAVNLCDLMVVFDSLSRRIQELADALDSLRNANPPTAYAPVLNNVTSSSMRVTANATSTLPIISYDFCISTNPDMSGGTWHTVQASDASYYIFEGLNSYVTYYIQYKATNLVGTATSPIASQRTPAHAPTADVTPPTTTNPAGFQVEVTDVDAKEAAEVTVRVCYIQKGAGDCPAKGSSAYSTCTDPVVVADGGSATISKTILTATTDYCVVVKVSNEDSTTIYGPYTVTTGDIPSISITSDGGGTVNLCGESTKDVPFTATITNDDASNYTFAWSAGSSTTSENTVSLSVGTHTIYVTATHTSSSFAISDTATVTVNSGGTEVSVSLCESEGVVSVKSVSGTPNSISWGDGQSSDGTVSTSTMHDYTTTLATGPHEVTITASNADGCTLSRTMTVTVLGSGSTVADRTVKPCNVVPASHAAQTGSAYTGNGHGGANHGLETVNGSGQVTSVTDYDGNEYPVVQIGSQCWMAENLRCSHSPKTGNNIVVTAVQNYGSKMAAWYNDDQSTYEPKRYGLLYNWCAVMDTAKPSGGGYTYKEVAIAANVSNKFSFNPSGKHQGVCPVGWHVPTDAEWNTMEGNVNGSAVSGSIGNRGSHAGKLSTGCDWTSSSTKNAAGNYANAERNDSGFSAVPAGFFRAAASEWFLNEGDGAYFSSATSYSNESTWGRSVHYDSASVARGDGYPKYRGFSVRCVRN